LSRLLFAALSDHHSNREHSTGEMMTLKKLKMEIKGEKKFRKIEMP